jgi:hypothetical protein
MLTQHQKSQLRGQRKNVWKIHLMRVCHTETAGNWFHISSVLLKDGREGGIILFQNVPDRPCGPPSLLFSGHRGFSHGGAGDWGMRLNTHLHLVTSGVISPFIPYTFLACTVKTLPLLEERRTDDSLKDT